MRDPKPKKTAARTGTDTMTGTMNALNPAASRAWSEITADWARFLIERLQEDLETQRALLACKSPAELLEVQSAFLKTAMAQYADYGKRLQDRIATATQDMMKAMRSGFSRGYDDVPL